MSWVAAGFATAAAVTGVVTVINSNNKANNALERQQEIDADMKALEDARQKIPDPSRHIKDLSRDIQNPYANLAVATGAAKMQAEETDLSLAATLDTLKATGASAGGATALAQAALRSKKGISANIEKQEAGNQQLRARGEQAMQTARAAERARVQSAKAAGEQWMFGKQETRELQGLNRMAAQQQQNQAQQMQYRAEAAQAAGMTSQAIMGGITAGIGAGQKSGTVDPKSGGQPELYNDFGGETEMIKTQMPLITDSDLDAFGEEKIGMAGMGGSAGSDYDILKKAGWTGEVNLAGEPTDAAGNVIPIGGGFQGF